MTNSDSTDCPKCDSQVPADSPGGLCPKCVLEGVASTPTAPTGGRIPQPPSAEEVATHFPELEVLELIGAGGMGAVYKARQPQLDRLVALKVLSHDLIADPSFAERFSREARVLARLSHPNIVAVYDYGATGPCYYLLMEFVDGVNLRQAMQANRFTPAESLTMVEEICAALKFAHEEGVLHRDIKPENVLIDSKGRVKIADFGIAKLVGDDQTSDVTLTLQGSVLGSPHYMAPEQIETPGDVDQRADIYSLGVVFYELLTGELPLGRFALPSEKASMDSRIDQIVLRTLEKERQARFQSADEVLTQVGAVAQNPGAVAPSATPVSVGEATSARTSLSSAIFTGVSLILVIMSFVIGNAGVMPRVREEIIALLLLGLSGCLAIVGIILGSVALREIRRSSGQKNGLGTAIFGVVPWIILLILFLGCLLVFCFFLMSPVNGASYVGARFLMICLVPSAIISAFFLVRTLRRWAGGVLRKDGGRDFPSMGRGMAVVAATALTGPILTSTIPRFLPDLERTHQPTVLAMEAEYSFIESMRKFSEMQESQIQWSLGAPELVLPIVISPGLDANFVLVLDEKGNRSSAEIGDWQSFRITRSGPPITSSIKIGSFGAEAERGFTALLGLTGDTGTSWPESDPLDWTFTPPGAEESQFAIPGRFILEIATRERKVGEGSGPKDSIRLEVTVTAAEE